MDSEEWKFLLNFAKNQEEEENEGDNKDIPEGGSNIGTNVVIKIFLRCYILF